MIEKRQKVLPPYVKDMLPRGRPSKITPDMKERVVRQGVSQAIPLPLPLPCQADYLAYYNDFCPRPLYTYNTNTHSAYVPAEP